MFQFSLSPKINNKTKQGQNVISRFRVALSYSPYVYLLPFFIAPWGHGLIEGGGGVGG